MFPAILGADAVVAWFGEWPSFHDAEILSIHIQPPWALRDGSRLDRTGRFILLSVAE